jgi:hypothetical protein
MMPRAAIQRKITILWLMVAIAALAVVFRGLMETPRVVRYSLWDGIATMYARRAEEAEARFEPISAASNRESAERYSKIARPLRPDPFGHACYVISVYGIPFGLVTAAATYWAQRRSRPPGQLQN